MQFSKVFLAKKKWTGLKNCYKTSLNIDSVKTSLVVSREGITVGGTDTDPQTASKHDCDG